MGYFAICAIPFGLCIFNFFCCLKKKRKTKFAQRCWYNQVQCLYGIVSLIMLFLFNTTQSSCMYSKWEIGIERLVSFQCPHEGCEWAFTTAYKLKRHARGHTGEKPYLVSYATCIYCCHSIKPMKQRKLYVLLHVHDKSIVCVPSVLPPVSSIPSLCCNTWHFSRVSLVF